MSTKGSQKSTNGWLVKIFIITFILSITFNYISTEVIENLNITFSIVVLILVILIGIISDMLATAVTAADEAPFHAKAADKKKGAKQAVKLVKNADKVSNFCGDVIGDICGVLSGAASALIAVNIVNVMGLKDITLVTMLITATVTAITVLGKGLGKHLALTKTNKIVYGLGVFLDFFS